MSGSLDDFQTLNHIHQLCEKEKDCFSQLTLSASGQARFLTFLRTRINKDFSIEVFDTGNAAVYIPCLTNTGPPSHIEKNVDRVTGQMLTKGLVTLSCEGQIQKTQYHLDSKVIIVDESSANSNGFKTQLNNLLTEIVSGKVDHWKNLESFFAAHKGKVIGDASLLLQSNKEATIKSGGEIPVIVDKSPHKSDDDRKRQTKWKEHGLKLQVTAFPVRPNITNLKYTLNVTEPVSDDSYRMQLNTLDSEIEIHLNDPKIVGGVEYKVSKSNEGGIPILSQVPIIAPLFKLVDHHEAKMMLFVWFYLKEEKV